MNACSHGSIFVCFSLGTAFPCCQCRVSAVPQYHLAMVDGTIRNFCSYDCVSIYRVQLFFYLTVVDDGDLLVLMLP